MNDSLDRQYETLCQFELHCPADIPPVQHDMALYCALRDVRNHPAWTPAECAVVALVRVLREVAS
jgi:hypothetical protein